MIVQKTYTLNGRVFVRTYSDAGRYVVRDGVSYTEANDPAELGCTYAEGAPLPPEDFDVQEAYEQLRTDLAAATSMLAGTENTMTATRNYAAGELVSIGGVLFAVTAAIPNSGVIAPGVNVTPTTMAEQLALLADKKS